MWKTTDGGLLWQPLTDGLSNLNHGCVAVDPSNPQVVYAGTGEYTLQTSGDGLFRSTDGGATWEQFATTARVGDTCSGLIVDPFNPMRIHLTGSRGYARLDDGGAIGGVRLWGATSSLALNPVDSSVLYVGLHWEGVYRSIDGGNTWVQLTNGIPLTGLSRILVAVAPSNPSTVYTAIVASDQRNLLGLFKSTDAGDTWVLKPDTPNFTSPQGWYDMFLGVDPANENIVYAGGVFPTFAVAGIIKSTDGGDTWTDITIGAFGGQVHSDQHAIAFGPTGTIWVGCDGGVWKSDNGGSSWINTNTTLTVTQNYQIALHPSDPAQLMGGTQDNGTVGRSLDVEEWPQIIAGDGGFLVYDFQDPTIKYTTFVRLTIFRFFGDFFDVEITGPWQAAGDPANFIAPLVMDPNDPHTLLGGTNRIWRTRDAHAGASWTPISDSTVAAGGTINAIAVAVGASDRIYSGSSTGRVFVTSDAAAWTDRSAGLPTGQISDLLLDPDDAGTAYVAYHNTSGPRVLRTADSGAGWMDVTGDLPAGVSARALAVDWRATPENLFIGSGAGVYSSFNGGISWDKNGPDLPNVNIGDLAIDFTNNTITAGTYGRGAWRASLDLDCNGNGVADADEIAAGTSPDCNTNLLPDECDLAGGAPDVNGNGVPDSCECIVASAAVADLIPNRLGQPVFSTKNRYLTFSAGDVGRVQAARVTITDMPTPFASLIGTQRWVGTPAELSTLPGKGFNDPVGPGEASVWVARLQCDPAQVDWSSFGVIHVRHESIIPGATYVLEMLDETCALVGTLQFSPSLPLATASWGDIAGPFLQNDRLFSAPDGIVEIATDVIAVLDGFSGRTGGASKPRADLEGNGG
ncbi:MAG: WD40/YVTN/BNR-like repeat-containing protein, partial [Phycisphaerae bacterium]